MDGPFQTCHPNSPYAIGVPGFSNTRPPNFAFFFIFRVCKSCSAKQRSAARSVSRFRRPRVSELAQASTLSLGPPVMFFASLLSFRSKWRLSSRWRGGQLDGDLCVVHLHFVVDEVYDGVFSKELAGSVETCLFASMTSASAYEAAGHFYQVPDGNRKERYHIWRAEKRRIVRSQGSPFPRLEQRSIRIFPALLAREVRGRNRHGESRDECCEIGKRCTAERVVVDLQSQLSVSMLLSRSEDAFILHGDEMFRSLPVLPWISRRSVADRP